VQLSVIAKLPPLNETTIAPLGAPPELVTMSAVSVLVSLTAIAPKSIAVGPIPRSAGETPVPVSIEEALIPAPATTDRAADLPPRLSGRNFAETMQLEPPASGVVQPLLSRTKSVGLVPVNDTTSVELRTSPVLVTVKGTVAPSVLIATEP